LVFEDSVSTVEKTQTLVTQKRANIYAKKTKDIR